MLGSASLGALNKTLNIFFLIILLLFLVNSGAILGSYFYTLYL